MATPPPANPNAPLTGASRHVDRQGLTAIVWVCFIVPTLFVFLRLFVRWHQNRRFLPDDYWIIFAWLCMLTMTALQTAQMDSLWYMTYLLAGRLSYDEKDIRAQHMEFARWQFPIINIFWIILWSVKASFLSIFYRLVQPFPIIRKLWYCVAVFAAISLVACIVSGALTCDPPSEYFNGGCTTDRDRWRAHVNIILFTTLDVTTDLMIMALPITVLPSLQLDKKKKIGLGIAFSLGIIIIAVAVVRMSQIIDGNRVDIIGLAIWGAVETATALIVGSLPALKGLLTRGIKKYTSTRSGRTDPTDYDSRSSHRRRGHGSVITPRALVTSDCIPLDKWHHSDQVDGGIYIHKTFTKATVTDDDSSHGNGDQITLVKGNCPRNRV
ncbi:hypothetical protein F53441_8191 [Fusarium austroafricanum]|uniref:Rhodopsin domain-containing protein n=1 Tax=Fusarium austroafricanum TaxID=2364996 RepID=A0A8H4NWS5_9HYPO|nr:hypothetical protein F53441_8191 [Fusarium austroafricanum]